MLDLKVIMDTNLHEGNLCAPVTDERVRLLFSPHGEITLEPRQQRKRHSTILVVDDDPNDLILIERAFRAIGVKDPIHTVSGGREAIAYMMREGRFSDRKLYEYPTFVMIDLQMPGGDGFAVLEYFKSNPEWAIIPTIVFSSSTEPDDINKCYMLGASSYHVKPNSTDELRRQLQVLHDYWMTCERKES